MNKADFFISHASEDKDSLVRELANNLMMNGALVFYDEYSIKLGDSLSDSINKGITNSDHAIIVLSKYFFEKGWTNAELQALFNKSIRENFKMLIVYHEVDHSQVSDKYPLLADIKGINSSVGIEKISQALFEAIGKQGRLAYLKHGFERKKEEILDGFSISMFVGFPNFANQQFEKVLFDLGNKDVFHSRLRLIYYQNRIYFEIIDSNYHRISISVDISNWAVGEQHFVHANFNSSEKQLFLFIDNQVADTLCLGELSIDNTFLSSATGIIGNSLELRNPCQFLIGTHSIGKSMDVEMVSKYSEIMSNYMSSIKNNWC
jgi:hypothetical protein